MTPLPVLMQDCPKFAACNAGICPLDVHRTGAIHLPGEPVCTYLLASGKVGAAERYAEDPVFAVALESLPSITARWSNIARAVERAAKYPLRTGDVSRLRKTVKNAA
jgi:hypothetical protein